MTPAAEGLRDGPPVPGYRRVAYAALTGIVAIASIPLVLSAGAALLGGDLAGLPFYLIFLLLPANLGVVGAVLATRRPDNRIGWLLLVAGALTAITFAAGEFSRSAFAAGDPASALLVAVSWVASWGFIPAVGILVVFLPLFFPTGRLPSPRWRPLVAVAIFGIAAGTVGLMIAPGPLGGDPRGPLNPFVPPEPALSLLQGVATIGNALAPPVFLLALASLLIRFRRSRDVERQQLKWFLLAAAIVASLFAVSLLPLGSIADTAWALGLVAMSFLPLAIGVAILRYRLYDIDRIVSRVVGYTLVTAVLGVSFAAVVVLTQAILAQFTEANTLAVAGSTLVVATLFQPVRRAIQARVDRRFDRSHVKAEAVTDSFSARLRDVTDLATIRASVVDGIETAWAPSAVGIWVRGAAAPGRAAIARGQRTG